MAERKRMKRLFIALALIFFGATALNAYEVKSGNFEKVIHSKRVVLVKFYATWCTPCKILKPEFEKAKKAVGKRALFVEYDVDGGKDILRKYGVQAVPTMILFENGKVVDRAGMLDAKNIKEWVLGYVPR